MFNKLFVNIIQLTVNMYVATLVHSTSRIAYSLGMHGFHCLKRPFSSLTRINLKTKHYKDSTYLCKRYLIQSHKLETPKQISEEEERQSRAFDYDLINSHIHRLASDNSANTNSTKELDTYLENDEPNLHLRYIYIMTCEQIWEDVPGGLFFDVAYLDSQPGNDFDADVPTILALHGYPGNHEDFRSLLMPFVIKGYRVIALTFPGCGETRGSSSGDEDVFTHSPQEQAEFVTDFMANLHLSKVDLLVSHGSASNAASLLTVLSRRCHSLLFITPMAHFYRRHIFKSWAAYNIQRLDDYMVSKPLAHVAAWCFKWFNGLQKFSLKSVIAYCKMLEAAEFEDVRGSVSALGIKNFPVLVVNYTDSPRSTQKDYREYEGLMNAFHHERPYPKCMQLETGGRVPLGTDAESLRTEIEALIDYSMSMQQPDKSIERTPFSRVNSDHVTEEVNYRKEEL